MFKKISITSKIVGIAIIMLLLFMLVAFINYVHLNKVNRELHDLAVHMVPLTEKITQIGVHSLQQEIHLERLVLLYTDKTLKQVNKAKCNNELAQFDAQTAQVEQALAVMQQLGDEAIRYATTVDKIVEYARLEPYLKLLKQAYQKNLQRTEQITRLLAQGQWTEAHLLMTQLTSENDDFTQQIDAILTQFIHFVEQSARNAVAHEQQIIELNLLLSALATIIGVLFASVLIIALTRPIHTLLMGTKEVTKGNLAIKLHVNSRDESAILGSAFDKMLAGIRQKEQLKATFGQYVDPRVVDLLIDHKKSGAALAHQPVATVFFSDIAGFSSISELLTAKGLVNLINHYLTFASAPIIKHQGVIDQFIGDAVVAFWSAPFTEKDQHAVLACWSALEQLEQLEKFRKIMPKLLGIRKGLPAFNVRMGLATSPVVAGYFGAEHAKSYTIMGQATQMAEALETANKRYGTTILISAETRKRAMDTIETRRIAQFVLPHTDQASPIYELLAKKGELTEDFKQLLPLFEQGLRAYEAHQWENAKVYFERCQQLKADDQPTHYYLTKMAAYPHKKIAHDA